MYVSCHFAVITKLDADILNLTFTLKSYNIIAQNRIPSQLGARNIEAIMRLVLFGLGRGLIWTILK